MKNLKNALAAGGAKLSDVTKVTIYICNPHDVPKARAILHDYFGKHPPGSTLCIFAGWQSEFPAGDRSDRCGMSRRNFR